MVTPSCFSKKIRKTGIFSSRSPLRHTSVITKTLGKRQLQNSFTQSLDTDVTSTSVQEFMFDLFGSNRCLAPDYVNVLYRTSDKFESVDIGVCFSNLDGSCDCQIY